MRLRHVRDWRNRCCSRARFRKSLPSWTRIWERIPTLDLCWARRFSRWKNTRRPEKQFQEAVAIQPDLAQAYYGLAVSCAALGRNDEAQANQEKFLELENLRQQAGRDPSALLRRCGLHREAAWPIRCPMSGASIRVCEIQGEAERLWLRAATVDPENMPMSRIPGVAVPGRETVCRFASISVRS